MSMSSEKDSQSIHEFKKELKNLLIKYNAEICVEYSFDYSDDHISSFHEQSLEVGFKNSHNSYHWYILIEGWNLHPSML